MATRTISQIAGDFGLARGSNPKVFKKAEKATLGTIDKHLNQLQSNIAAGAFGRGQGRSTFSEGLFQQERADILGRVGQQFAQARLSDVLADRQSDRGLYDLIGQNQIAQEYAKDNVPFELKQRRLQQEELLDHEAELKNKLAEQESIRSIIGGYITGDDIGKHIGSVGSGIGAVGDGIGKGIGAVGGYFDDFLKNLNIGGN